MTAEPMFVRVFQYTTTPGRCEEFEHAYGADGEWVRLFAASAGYMGSTLERADDDRYRTQDLWRSASHFTAFLAANQEAYDAIDRMYGPLKLTEEHCGHFTERQPAGAEWRVVS